MVEDMVCQATSTGDIPISSITPAFEYLRPISGLVGFKYLYTQTVAKQASDWVLDWMAYYVNFDDWALTYGIGVGTAITLWELGSEPGPVSKNPIGVHFDFGVRYLLGSEAEYLKEGSIQVVGDQVTFLPEQSKTDMIHPHFRIRVSF